MSIRVKENRRSHRVGLAVLWLFAAIHWPAVAEDRIQGRLRFSPQVAGIIEASINIFRAKETSPVTVVPVSATSPFDFGAPAPAHDAGNPLKIVVSVDWPKNYVPSVPFYEKRFGIPFNETVLLRIKADVFSSQLQRASSASKAGEAEDAYNYALALAVGDEQKLFTYRQYAGWAGSTNGPKAQLKILEEARRNTDFGEIKDERKLVYWKERFDGYLRSVDFLKQPEPIKSFGSRVSRSDELHGEWQKMVTEFSKDYPAVIKAAPQGDSAAVSAQLSEMRTFLGHSN